MLQKFKNLDIADKNLYLLCTGSLLTSSAVHFFWLVLPFVSKAIGGSDTEVGLSFAAYMGIYSLTCIAAGLTLEKLKAKKVLLCSLSANVMLIIFMFFLVLWGKAITEYLPPIYILVSLTAMMGMATAFFWPTMMGWVSTGFDGEKLNRRFSFYNMSWSSAAIIAPLISGYMAEVSYLMPVVSSAVLLSGAIVAVSFTHCVSRMPVDTQPQTDSDVSPDMVRKYRHMARIGLFASFVCVAVLRSQLALLFKFELKFSESYFGWAMGFCLLVNWAVFAIMGRNRLWHYKFGYILLAQAFNIAAMALILNSRSVIPIFIGTAFTGACGGFLFSSHMYYGVTGRQKRQSKMAIHEITVGTGFFTGAILGGFLSDHYGRYMPYKFVLAVTIAAILCQTVILMRKNKVQSFDMKETISI